MAQVKLSPETKSKISEHFNQHWAEPRICPICKSTRWHLQPGELFRPLEERSGEGQAPGFASGEGAIPTIQAVCGKCFYVHTFLLAPIVGGEEAKDLRS